MNPEWEYLHSESATKTILQVMRKNQDNEAVKSSLYKETLKKVYQKGQYNEALKKIISESMTKSNGKETSIARRPLCNEDIIRTPLREITGNGSQYNKTRRKIPI